MIHSQAAQEHCFQVNLGGMIELLSNHLYSDPRVYIRELLQNAVDAIEARRLIQPNHLGRVLIEVVDSEDGTPTLMVEDDGVGLTEAEVHEFLATIGKSSKRGELSEQRSTFIGQFGIGLLSCFMVSEEIAIVTKSARHPEAPPVEWRGKPDGTYKVRTLERDLKPGTRVYLVARPGCQELLSVKSLEVLVRHYGGLLPMALELSANQKTIGLNDVPPWRKGCTDEQWRQETLAYGERLLGEKFFDAIPLPSIAEGVEGVAYVLANSGTVGSTPSHRVYIKGMLVSEASKKLLPDWAFFVRCVVDARTLRPTASREDLYENEDLDQVRNALGQALKQYLIGLAETDSARLQRLISLHYPALKALAVENDDLLRLFFNWLPFETSLGRMTGQEIRENRQTVCFVNTVDRFRQIASVATAQSMLVINAGYTHDTEILDHATALFSDISFEEIDPAELSEAFEELSLTERDCVHDFLRLADVVLQPFGVQTEARRFKPIDLPAIYLQNEAAETLRSISRTKDISNDLFSNVLDGIAQGIEFQAHSRLCFNFDNETFLRMVDLPDRALQERVVQMLYVQALLLGQYPLGHREIKLMNKGLLGLIDMSLNLASLKGMQ